MSKLVSGDFDEIARAARKFLAVYECTSETTLYVFGFNQLRQQDKEDLNHLADRLETLITDLKASHDNDSTTTSEGNISGSTASA